MKKIPFFLFFIFLSSCLLSNNANWVNTSDWQVNSDGKSQIKLESIKDNNEDCLKITYDLDVSQGYGWVEIIHNSNDKFTPDIPVTFKIKANSPSDVEYKFMDKDKSVFGKKVPLKDLYKDWTDVVIYLKNTDYWWGGSDDNFGDFASFNFAFSGKGSGTILIKNMSFGKPGTKTDFPIAGANIDPNAELDGIGFDQRRDDSLIEEDPLVLEYLKQIQDSSSSDKQLLPSMEGNQAQTFNNTLVALAFMLKNEKTRAERILDFYSTATVKGMWCPDLQNFYYKDEARGFFQHVNLYRENGTPAYCNTGNADRWMGDMCWLLTAYKYYEKKYNSDKYTKITNLLKNLLLSWYKDADDGNGGYIQHGWRKGDKYLHEKDGHPEGNIDAYAVMKLCGEDEIAGKIKTWLDSKLKGKTLPLDLYTWRTLAFDNPDKTLLNIPDYDLRYRKTLNMHNRKISGFYPFANAEAQNIWFDGNGHIACSYYSIGNFERGNFYSNQYDSFKLKRIINSKVTHAIPYVAKGEGDFGWVDTSKGFVSSCAWYIFSKNHFNPLKLEQYTDNSSKIIKDRYPVIETKSKPKNDIKKTSLNLKSIDSWNTFSDNSTPFSVAQLNSNEISIDYNFEKGTWVILTKENELPQKPLNRTISFQYKSSGASDNIEVKWTDQDGSVFGYKISEITNKEYKTVTIKPEDIKYWWGGNKSFETPKDFEIAISQSKGTTGKIFIKDLKVYE